MGAGAGELFLGGWRSSMQATPPVGLGERFHGHGQDAPGWPGGNRYLKRGIGEDV